MIVNHRREQVVRRGYRVDVARKVQVDVLHRRNLSVTAACRAALYAEHRTQRRLAEREAHASARLFQPVGKPY